jgi:hypothetical protein
LKFKFPLRNEAFDAGHGFSSWFELTEILVVVLSQREPALPMLSAGQGRNQTGKNHPPNFTEVTECRRIKFFSANFRFSQKENRCVTRGAK